MLATTPISITRSRRFTLPSTQNRARKAEYVLSAGRGILRIGEKSPGAGDSADGFN